MLLLIYWKHLFWSLTIALFAIALNTSILPITGFYFILYILTVFICSTWLTFVALQSFFQQNRALNLEKYLNYQKTEEKQCDLMCVKGLTTDIDKYFIQNWFVYISNDDTFNKESQIQLEEILRRVLKVQLNVDNDVVIHGVLNIYLRHLKEFRRALKRQEKYGGKVTELYKYSHNCSNSAKSQEYFIHQLTVHLLNQFINWELNNSLPCRVLVAVIARKFTNYILNLLSNPDFINYYILWLSTSENKKNELNLKQFVRVKVKIPNEEESDLKSSSSSNSLSKQEDSKKSDDSFEISSKIFENEEVKIHEPKSCKTWYDSYDLESVTLGQDILDMLNDGNDDVKAETSPMTQAKSLLDEMKHMTSIEGIKTSMKPFSDVTVNTLHNIKDFTFQDHSVNDMVKPVSQVTSNALHKIGGFQDEAAGVVEGILDFGRTKIRRGLRLTGLEAELNRKKPTISKIPHIEDAETVWINPVQETPIIHKIPSILHEDTSPDPEYEEAADLATSIAKLRSLLEQKSSESTMSTPSLSPMPPDDTKHLEMDNMDETDGMMPTFYKFCAKTATGVLHNTLNTIKTALPSTNLIDLETCNGWLFVESNPTDHDLYQRMTKLLTERKVFCTIDTAYEAIDSLASLKENDIKTTNIQFEDELDDFEVKIPISKALLDVICELLSDAKNTPLTQEPIIKSILLIFGNFLEETIKFQINSHVNYWCNNAKIPSETRNETLFLSLDSFIDALLTGIPDSVKYVMGEENLRHSMELFVKSLQVQKINQDFVMQVFEIICLKLMEGSKQLSPLISF